MNLLQRSIAGCARMRLRHLMRVMSASVRALDVLGGSITLEVSPSNGLKFFPNASALITRKSLTRKEMLLQVSRLAATLRRAQTPP